MPSDSDIKRANRRASLGLLLGAAVFLLAATRGMGTDQIRTATPVCPGGTLVEGSSVAVARADHQHSLCAYTTAALPVTCPDSALAWDTTSLALKVCSSNAWVPFAGSSATISGTLTSGKITLAPIVFASIGAPANGTIAYCSDCTIANPCAGAGTGAFAKRLNGIWVCN